MSKFLKFALASSLLFSAVLIASAETATSNKITFPVAELGNCGSQVECRAFCNKAENIEVCTEFAQKHNLITREEKERNQKFSKALKKGETPGGCKDAESCKVYCENGEHLEECVKFAESNNLLPAQELQKAKKFKQVLENKETPGGCKSEKECKVYCDAEEHQEACLDFAEKHGFIEQDEVERAKKFIPLMKTGQTPGACKSKETCEAYCHEQDHQTECLDFAVKVGAMKPEQAEKFKKTNGQGPGGCKGRQECEAFCNNPDHKEECIAFAKERGFIKEGDEQNIKQGEAGMRMGVNNLPPEVKECLENKLDDDTISQIQNGQFTPTAEVGVNVKNCFEQFKPQMKQHMQQQFQADPQTEDCVKQAVGEDVFNEVKRGQAPPDPELSKKMRECFDQHGQREQEQGEMGPNDSKDSRGQDANGQMQMMHDCIAGKLGEETAKKMDQRQIDTSSAEVKQALNDCVKQFQGQNPQNNFNSKNRQPGRPEGGTGGVKGEGGDSSKIKNCLMDKLGEDGMKKMADPAFRGSEEMQNVLKECGYNINNNSSDQPPKDGQQYLKPPQENQYPNNYPPPDYKNPQPPEQYNQYPPEGGPPQEFGQPPAGSQPYYQQPPSGQVQGASTERGLFYKLWHMLIGN